MTHFLRFFVLLALLTQFCTAADEFDAFCSFANKVDPDGSCVRNTVVKQCDMSNSSISHSFSVGPVSVTCTSKHIVELAAVGGELNGLPDSFSRMTYLKSLNLANNQFESFPDVLGEMPFIKTLNLAGNKITKMSAELDKITSLQTLNLASNGLEQFEGVLGSLKALTILFLMDNKLTNITGVFPNSLKLTNLYLSKNNLTELPPEFAKCTNLKSFLFENNDISKLPPGYKDLKNLHSVAMSGNNFTCSDFTDDLSPFKDTVFADGCVQSQQKSEKGITALPLSYSTEPPNEGLDKYEVTSLILFFVFLIGLALAVVFYIRYRNGGMAA